MGELAAQLVLERIAGRKASSRVIDVGFRLSSATAPDGPGYGKLAAYIRFRSRITEAAASPARSPSMIRAAP